MSPARKDERRRAALAATLAYWTPERRAEQWAHVVANGAAVDVGNSLRQEIGRVQREIVNIERAVYDAAYAALLSSPAFDAKVAAKRAMLKERAPTRLTEAVTPAGALPLDGPSDRPAAAPKLVLAKPTGAVQ